MSYYLLKESLGCFIILDVLIQPRLSLIKGCAEVTKQHGLPAHILNVRLEVLLQQGCQFFLSQTESIIFNLLNGKGGTMVDTMVRV